MGDFGKRFKEAFGDIKYAEIAKKIGVGEQAVKNYIGGRVPDSDKLLRISEETNCNLHWLLTGNGEKFLNVELSISIDDILEQKMREIFWQEINKDAVNEKIQGVFFALQPNIKEIKIQDSSLIGDLEKTG